MNTQLIQDLEYTYGKLSSRERQKLSGSSILITGAAGSLGYYLTHFFYYFRDKLALKKVICLDNFMLDRPDWIAATENDPRFVWRNYDVIKDDLNLIPEAAEADLIIHMASVASPPFYRQYPIETLDANVWGLRRLLEYYKECPIRGLLFFSSSEIYGDPAPEAIPTPEIYWGNVSTTGPRACYDESKRFGETMCALFAQAHGMPVRVVRPFNNHGPGMRLDDGRVSADFARQVLNGEDIQLLSNGTPTRTFCYAADAAAGYLKVLLHNAFDFFNIGIGEPEITMEQLAQIYQKVGRELFGYQGDICYRVSEDQHYLTDNPQRRCPDLTKARTILGYRPEIDVEEGVRRFLCFWKEELA